MGHRELKRVPLNFEAPLNEVWKGFINPHQGPVECRICGGTGRNPATKQISDDFYDFKDSGRRWHDNITQDEVQALVDANRLWDFTRIPLNEEHHEVIRNNGGYWLPYDNGRIPTAAEVNASQKTGFGHDAINRWILIEARAKRLGVWGGCKVCRGHGSKFPAHVPHRAFRSWKEYEPPKGAGYQLWETCSEGSPISPVFASAHELAFWCESGATIFADEKLSYSQWLSMLHKEDGVDAGSMFIASSDYVGSLANSPHGRSVAGLGLQT